jgi:4-hydroxybenzoate polyprenyltransferase
MASPSQCAVVEPSTPRALASLLEAMRPKQWFKNVFVLAGVVFSGQLFDGPSRLRALIIQGRWA